MPAEGYVRRLARYNYLTYHRASCRHVRGREDVVVVDRDEVVRAARMRRFQRVEFEGREVCLNVCQSCRPLQELTSWP